MRAALNFEDIIAFETKRAGPIRGFDLSDLIQEMRLHVALRCLPKLSDENTGRTFVRVSVRRALQNLKRDAHTAMRMPRDARGRPLYHDFPLLDDDLLTGPNTPDPERVTIARDLTRQLLIMEEEDRRLLYEAFVDGVTHRGQSEKVESARKRAESILTNVLKDVQPERRMLKRHPRREGERTMNDKADNAVLECHAHGADPVGYETDLADAQDCQDCLDKMTCLADGIKSGLIDATMDIDPESKAWHKGLITIDALRKRINLRVKLREEGKSVPEDLTYDHPPVAEAKLAGKGERTMNKKNKKPEATEEMEPTEVEAEEAAPEEAPEPKAKKAKKAKAAAEPEGEDEAEAPPAPKAKKVKAAPVPEPKAKKSKKAPVAEDDDDEDDGPAPKAPKIKKGKKAPPPPAPTKVKKGKKDGKAEKAAEPKVKKAKKDSAGPSNRSGEKGRFKYEGKPKTLADGRVQLPNGRFVPAPKEITKERMEKSLADLNGKLGLDFDLLIGMQLVQERRGGDNVVVSLKKDGYHLKTADLDATYSSLSGACMAAFLRSVSGVAVFDFTKNNNIVVKGKAVPGGSYRRGEAE